MNSDCQQKNRVGDFPALQIIVTTVLTPHAMYDRKGIRAAGGLAQCQ